MGVDRRLVLKEQVLIGAVRDSHDVHVVEVRPAFAPVAVREDVVAAHLAPRFNLPALGHRPMEEAVVARDRFASGSRLHML